MSRPHGCCNVHHRNPSADRLQLYFCIHGGLTMRVIVIDEELPFPVNTGKRLRTFNLLKHLSLHHEIVFICRCHAEGDSGACGGFKESGIEVITVPPPLLDKKGLKFYCALFLNLFSIYPYSVSSHYSKMLVQTIEKEIGKKKYDLIHCEWTPYAINLQSVRDVPLVVDAHNVEALIWQRNCEVARNPLVKAYFWLQWKKMARFEKAAFADFRRIAAVSEQDRAIITRWVSPDKVKVIENGVDIDYFQPSLEKPEPGSLVFTGSMDWRANVDAMIYFLDQVWPLLLAKCPQARLCIVGRNPLPVLKARVQGESRVLLTGTVDDVRPYIAKAAVYIVPLRVGGGSRLKILEALSMRKAVVSTTIGAEGLELEAGRDLLVADHPRDFCNRILSLFHDEELRTRLGENG
ncbi:MAG: glycosyltransferase family 4 protein, partial [Desulfatitalea sp.]